MLKVQEYLRSGKTLDDLKAEFAIGSRINEKLNVACLNYSMIESPMGEEIVQEFRSLILDMTSWNVKGWAFKKFFNYGEGHVSSDFNWSDFKTYEKLDGSLITLWYHETEGWQVSTRSIPDGSNEVDDSGMSYRDLVIKTLHDMGVSWSRFIFSMDSDYCYAYELMTPENQVVVHYDDRKLVLTAIRHLKTLEEVNIHGCLSLLSHPTPLVTLHKGFSLDAVKDFVQTRNPLEHEGFVLIDSNFNRVKLKSDAYCLMSHQRDGLGKSNKARLELILSGQDDDVIHILPQFVQDKIVNIKNKLVSLVSSIEQVYEEIKGAETQKDFALLAIKHRFSGVLFALRAGKVESAIDWFKNASPKSTLEWLNLEEDDNVEA